LDVPWSGSFKGKEISQDKLQQLWTENFPSKAFPSVRAWTLRPKHFFKWHRQLVASGHTLDREVEEYGSKGPLHLTCAFVIRGKAGYGIFRNSSSRFTEEEDLTHELGHIFRGELKTEMP
jgi:hypothetical protein